MAARLRGHLGRDVRTVLVGDYRALVDGLVAGELDLAWMPPAPYLEAEASGAGAVAVARRYGKTAYHGAIVVRADAPHEKLEDLRGCSVAWVEPESASGYLFAAAELRLGTAPQQVVRIVRTDAVWREVTQ